MGPVHGNKVKLSDDGEGKAAAREGSGKEATPVRRRGFPRRPRAGLLLSPQRERPRNAEDARGEGRRNSRRRVWAAGSGGRPHGDLRGSDRPPESPGQRAPPFPFPRGCARNPTSPRPRVGGATSDVTRRGRRCWPAVTRRALSQSAAGAGAGRPLNSHGNFLLFGEYTVQCSMSVSAAAQRNSHFVTELDPHQDARGSRGCCQRHVPRCLFF